MLTTNLEQRITAPLYGDSSLMLQLVLLQSQPPNTFFLNTISNQDGQQ
jgi:hypothetical protein